MNLDWARKLDDGLIFLIAAHAGIALKGKGVKRTCRCPLHDDRSASAFLSADNIFFCSVCTPGGGLSAKQFCQRVGLNWSHYLDGRPRERARPRERNEPPAFSAVDAQCMWRQARVRARDDDAVDADGGVYRFLGSRGLMEATECGVLGVFSTDMTLPEGVRSWPKRGYSLVAPLFDLCGNIVSLQSRSVRGGDPKTLAPTGGRLAGTVFADERGIAVLRGNATVPEAVILGEGLTDYLALSIASSVAVLSVPGTSNAEKAAGAWARGRIVILALDCDEAGRARVESTAAELRDHGVLRVLTLTWPECCKDACDVVARHSTDGLHAFLTSKFAKVLA